VRDGSGILGAVSEPLCILNKDWIGPRAQFVADPFLRQYGDRWVLFFEVMWDNGHKQIGVAESPDLVQWDMIGFALDKAPCSFPYVLWHAGFWWMFPYHDDIPDLLVYRATESEFPLHWQEWASFELDKSANDRVVIPLADRLVVLYGSRIWPWAGTCLKWGSLSIDKRVFDPGGHVKVRSPIQWLANRIWGKSITTFRLAGDRLTVKDRSYVPLQAYGKQRVYGNQVGLFSLTFSREKPRIRPFTYFEGSHFLPRWDFTHHLSSQWDGDHLILAVDGHATASGWEIGIFRIDVRQTFHDH
jgi:hypothetical protein